MRVGRLVAFVVTTTLRFVLEVVPPERPPDPAPVRSDPCDTRVDEQAGRGSQG